MNSQSELPQLSADLTRAEKILSTARGLLQQPSHAPWARAEIEYWEERVRLLKSIKQAAARTRCPKTTKIVYATQVVAKQAASYLQDHNLLGEAWSAYQCTSCQLWHIGHTGGRAPIHVESSEQPCLPAVRVDLEFLVVGQNLPIDHGHALFAGICNILGDLRGAEWLGIQIKSMVPSRQLLWFTDDSKLVLRVETPYTQRMKFLAGRKLNILGHHIEVGEVEERAIQPISSLSTRLAVINGRMEESSMEEGVRKKLTQVGVSADLEIGRRRVVKIKGDVVVGFGIRLSNLSARDSLILQYAGIGGRQRMGCGIVT